eukprot:7629692-Pyramimonas_sp.AAC.1
MRPPKLASTSQEEHAWAPREAQGRPPLGEPVGGEVLAQGGPREARGTEDRQTHQPRKRPRRSLSGGPK